MTEKERILKCLPKYPTMIDMAEISKKSKQPLWFCSFAIRKLVKEGEVINLIRSGRDVYCQKLTIYKEA